MSGKGRIVEHMENEVENIGVTHDNGQINEHLIYIPGCNRPGILYKGKSYCCPNGNVFNPMTCVEYKPRLPQPKFSYNAACIKLSPNFKTICVCDPAAKGYKLDGTVCKPDSTVNACPIVNKKQLILGSEGLCV
jgi:hypothetical protein